MIPDKCKKCGQREDCPNPFMDEPNDNPLGLDVAAVILAAEQEISIEIEKEIIIAVSKRINQLSSVGLYVFSSIMRNRFQNIIDAANKEDNFALLDTIIDGATTFMNEEEYDSFMDQQRDLHFKEDE